MLTCSALGTAPLEYQWSHNGTTIPAAKSTTYTVSSVEFRDAGTYTCQVSNWADESSETYTLNVQGTYSIIIHSLVSFFLFSLIDLQTIKLYDANGLYDMEFCVFDNYFVCVYVETNCGTVL